MTSGRTVPATSDIAVLQTELIHRLGDGAVTDNPSRLAGYTSDTYWRALAAQAAGEPLGRPDLVALPRDEAGVRAALELADEHRVPVVPWGGGSGTQGGAVPVRGGLLLDLSGLDRIVEIDERSLTVTAEAGVNGRRLERELNERGLMLPHSVGPELTQLFVGSEGTLGAITRATLRLAPLPAERRFATVTLPSIGAGIEAFPRAPAARHRPSVIRMYDDEATRLALSPVVGEQLEGVCTVLCFEGEREAVAVEAERTLAAVREQGGRELDPTLAETWWKRRYEFYYPPHQPELPAIWGTIDVVAPYSRIELVYHALRAAVKGPYAHLGLQLRMHFSHWYPWGTMIYARFVIPDGGDTERGAELHDRVWDDGVEAVFAA